MASRSHPGTMQVASLQGPLRAVLAVGVDERGCRWLRLECGHFEPRNLVRDASKVKCGTCFKNKQKAKETPAR